MEQLNRVEMIGIVGSCRESLIGETKVLRFTLATNFAYKAKDGTAVIETTWMECVAFGSEGKPLPDLKKCDKVHLFGRLRNQRITLEDGRERSNTEVRVSKLEIIRPDEPLLYQM